MHVGEYFHIHKRGNMTIHTETCICIFQHLNYIFELIIYISGISFPNTI